MSLFWLELSLRKRWRALSQRLRRVGCDRISVWRRLARREGLDLAPEIDASQWPIPFTYRRPPFLCLHAFEFEFPHRPGEGVFYVGPMVSEARVDRRAAEAEASLAPIFERRRRLPQRRRLIYAGFGSELSVDEKLLRRLLRAVATRPDWEMILSLAGRSRAETLGELPDNVHAFPWVPQLRVLREADVAVTHGGINTLDECVYHAVPVLVHIGGETDMAGNASRVVHHGLGIVGRPDDSASTLHDHLDGLLVERRFRDNVDRLRSSYERYLTDRVAERVVESLIDGQPAQ
jgi:UDP:flavonoid glycosyltransferase YjiC (YdhE family)